MDSSSASASKPKASNRIDPAWKNNILQDPRDITSVTCIFCGKVSKWGHLQGKAPSADDLVFGDDEGLGGLTWGAVNRAAGAGEPIKLTRTQTKSTRKNPSPSVGSSKVFTLRDEVDDEEDIEVYKSDENEESEDDNFTYDNSSGGDSEGGSDP